jgi:pilus assembly protein CpaB
MTYRLRNILIALTLAVVAALLVTFYVANYKRHVQHQQVTVPVVVAAKDIPVGTAGADLLAHNYLKVESVPRPSVVPGALSSPSQIGAQIAMERVYAGEQVTARRFGHVSPTGVRAKLKGTYRALRVPGDPNSLLAGTLQPGDHVDVVASVKYTVKDVDVKRLAAAATGTPTSTSTSTSNGSSDSGSGDEAKVATRTVLRNIDVLETSGASIDGKIASGPGDGGNWVMLAVTDNEAQKLYWVMKNATWSLTLRPVLDPADSPNSVETIQSVLGDGMRLSQYVELWIGRTPTR